MRKLSGLCILLTVLVLPLVCANSAFASSVKFESLQPASTATEIIGNFTQRKGTLSDPDVVTLRAGATATSFRFSLSVAGEKFQTNGQCNLDWGDDAGVPAYTTVSCSGGKFTKTQLFDVPKSALGISNGGTETMLYALEVQQANYQSTDNDVWRYIEVTFMADSESQPALVLDKTTLDANRNQNFESEIYISANTTGNISDLSLSEKSWNGLTLELSQSSKKITIKGKPNNSENKTFVVSGKVGGVTVQNATFTIRVSDVATYYLTAKPDTVPFTRSIYSQNVVTIESNTGKTPTNIKLSLTSWKDLRIGIDGNKLTVYGTPSGSGSQTITVSGKVDGRDATPATFNITVYGSDDDDDDEESSGCNAAPGIGILLSALPLLLLRRKQ